MSDTYLVTGGTGSFGYRMVRHLLQNTSAEVRVFSRDEAKQDAMRTKFPDSRLKLYLGDVRDSESVASALSGVRFVFHAAALKQVPAGEFFPMEFVKTNVIGTSNLLRQAALSGVDKVVCLSTDKAVYPINAMGISKAMMEKVAISFAREQFGGHTKVSVTRYGNVLMSRGSVVPRFLEQVKAGKPLTVTNGEMTRFLMTLDDSVELVLQSFSSESSGDILVKKSPAATISDLAQAVNRLSNREPNLIEEIGVRHAEKLYESLLSSEEHAVAQDLGDYYRIPVDDRDLNYENYFNRGEQDFSFSEGYHSHNAERLGADAVEELLSSLPEFKQN